MAPLSSGMESAILSHKRNEEQKQNTVTFISHDIKKKALERCDRTTYSAEHGNGSMIVNVEDEFIGLMTLYMPESGTPNLE